MRVAAAAHSIVLAGALLFVHSALGQICQVVVPNNALSAYGLATPFVAQFNYTSANTCSQITAGQQQFVHGVIADLETGTLYSYTPLIANPVIYGAMNPGAPAAQVAIQPTVPTLPAYNVIGLWFGSNGMQLTPVPTLGTNSSGQANCFFQVNVNDTMGMGQYAYCNAAAFYGAVNNLILSGKLTVPKLGTALDGSLCQNTRDWMSVDQDPSDNVHTFYIMDGNMNVAQYSAANLAALTMTSLIVNPSDNLVITNFIMPNTGCATSVWKITDLVNVGTTIPTLPTNEIQAAMHASYPQALIPLSDDFTQTITMQAPMGPATLYPAKTNLYRIGVNQPTIHDVTTTSALVAGKPLTSFTQVTGEASPVEFCNNYNKVGGPRLQRNSGNFIGQAGPAVGLDLFAFLVNRFNAANAMLNCTFFIGAGNVFTPVY